MADSAKKKAWLLFDDIIASAMGSDDFLRGPWKSSGEYEPDLPVLERLLGVPLHLKASSQSGVPALALDVWVAYELRRSGFAHDAVWPRATHPRVMPTPVANYANSAYKAIQERVRTQLGRVSPLKGVVATDARILGRHYVKQVDVVMSAWETGPEVLISTKRMDSSFGKNAANRMEEAYGDAKNLRSRHPLAAHGFVYGLRSTILESEPDKAKWLIDLLGKLAREDDAYDSVCLLMLDYEGEAAAGADGGHEDEEDAAAIELSTESRSFDDPATDESSVEDLTGPPDVRGELESLPAVRVLQNGEIPVQLSAGVFFREVVEHVLQSTPVTMHEDARRLRGWPTVSRGMARDQGALLAPDVHYAQQSLVLEDGDAESQKGAAETMIDDA